MLRNDLDKVRMLAELTRKREREKLRQAQVIKDMVDSFLFPHDGKLRLALETLSAYVHSSVSYKVPNLTIQDGSTGAVYASRQSCGSTRLLHCHQGTHVLVFD